MSEFNLSENAEVLLDFGAMVKIEDFDMVAGEGFGLFFHQDKVKEFIKRLKEDINKSCMVNSLQKERFIWEIDKLAGKDLT